MNIHMYIECTEKLLKEILQTKDYKYAFFLLLNILTKYDDRFEVLKKLID